MDRCVRLAYRYHDVDLVELTASAWNGKFGGSARLYVGHGELADAAETLIGFPVNTEDTRDVTFGSFGPESGGGAMFLKFSCVDRAGHCQLQLKLESDPILQSPLECVELISGVEPAALDRFVEQLRILNSSLTGSAMLVFS
jgi:hypothetical protein